MGQAARAIELGTPLSPDEQRIAPAIDPAEARQFYDMRQKVAYAARRELREALFAGLPRMAPGNDALVGLQHARVTRLVNAYVIACKALEGAANALCDVMDWTEDQARDEGVEWECNL